MGKEAVLMWWRANATQYKKGIRIMFDHLFRRARGQGLVEYALIIALVAVVVIGILILLGPAIGSIFSNIQQNL
jgi:pilus assembly protein Flp/PilA